MTDHHPFSNRFNNRTSRHARHINIDEPDISHPARQIGGNAPGLVAITMPDHRRRGGPRRGQQIFSTIRYPIGNRTERNHALVQEARLGRFRRAILRPLVVARHAGREVLRVLGHLADRLRTHARGALGEGVDLADALVRGRAELERLVRRLRLLRERVGALGEQVGEPARARDDEARGRGRVLHERGGAVGRVLGHAEEVVVDGAHIDAVAVGGDFDFDGIWRRVG